MRVCEASCAVRAVICLSLFFDGLFLVCCSGFGVFGYDSGVIYGTIGHFSRQIFCLGARAHQWVLSSSRLYGREVGSDKSDV